MSGPGSSLLEAVLPEGPGSEQTEALLPEEPGSELMEALLPEEPGSEKTVAVHVLPVGPTLLDGTSSVEFPPYTDVLNQILKW